MIIRKTGIVNVQLGQDNFAIVNIIISQIFYRKFIILTFQLVKQTDSSQKKLFKFSTHKHNFQLVKFFPQIFNL